MPENQNLMTSTMQKHGTFIKIGGLLILLVLSIVWVGIAITGFLAFFFSGAHFIRRAQDPAYQGDRLEQIRSRDRLFIRGLLLMVFSFIPLAFA